MTAIINAIVEILKIFPKYGYWILLGLAIGVRLLNQYSGLTTKFTKDQQLFALALEWILWPIAILLGLVLAIAKWRERKQNTLASERFNITIATPHSLNWSETKQPDGAIYTQITADVLVKNKTLKPVGLASVRLIKPKIKGQIIHNSALIKNRKTGYSETTAISGAYIAPEETAMVNLHLILSGTLKNKCFASKQIKATLGIVDDGGGEVRFAANFNRL